MKRRSFALNAILLALLMALTAQAQRYSSIRPGQLWLDTEGKPIQAHGFQIFEHDGTYYWYGENKEHTHMGSNVWTWGIRAYRSKDFYNWEDLGLIIPPDTTNVLSPLHYSQTLDRPHILYNKKTHKWVCWIKSMATDGFFVVLQANNFEGPYEFIRTFKPDGFGVGDFDMYCDPKTGKGYVWFERPHWEMICAELTEDFLNTNGRFSEHFIGLRPPYTREAPSHFVYHGRHYLFTSGTTGYVPNPSKVAVFDDYHGTYTDLGNPYVNDTFEDSFGSQITSVIKIPGKNLYVALADRWLPQLYKTDIPKRIMKDKEKAYLNHKPQDRDFSQPHVTDKSSLKRNQWDTTDKARYVFLPITFDSSGVPRLVWHDEWRLEDYDIPSKQDVGPQAMTDDIDSIVAPFPMPQLEKPVFPNRKCVVRMAKRGMSTHAIQSAIDRISKLGGGKVVIPAGHWLSGRIELKSNVNLYLSKGAEVQFSGNIKDYLPVVFTRDEGIEVKSLGAFIYAHHAENIAVTGEGRIVGPDIDCEIYQTNKAKALNIEKIVKPDMPLEQRVFDGNHNGGEVFLPKSIAPIKCKNVLIEGITIDKGLYWNVVPQYCENVIIRGVTVNSFGHGRTDGIDIESSKNVLVEYCSLDCQDDCYTMKSGRNEEGVRIGIPTENVVVRKCLALRGAGGIVCGTELAGGIKNIYCHDCVFDGTDQAFRVKTLRARGGGLENIIVERVRADVLREAFFCDMLGSVKWGGEKAKRYPNGDKHPAVTNYTPNFNTITIRDVIINNCQRLIQVKGLPERPLRNVLLSGFKANCQKFMTMSDVDGFVIHNANITAKDDTAEIDGCSSVMMLNTKINGQKPRNISYHGSETLPVIIQ